MRTRAESNTQSMDLSRRMTPERREAEKILSDFAARLSMELQVQYIRDHKVNQ